MKKLKDIFNVSYGTKLDFNKLEVCDNISGINFVSRTSQNNGIVAKVKKFEDKKPLKKQQITVSLGGSYVLSAFLQIDDFYTEQNVAVLNPIEKLSERELFYYCMCITKNRFRYGAFGREANTTLKDLLIPSKDEIPSRVYTSTISDYSDIKDSLENKKVELNIDNRKYFELQSLFNLEKGKGPLVGETEEIVDGINFITASEKNNGVSCKISYKATHKGNSISIASNGSVGETFYQDNPFCATGDLNILLPKFKLNKYIAIFIISIIRKEKYRFSYERKWGIEKMKTSQIKLPTNKYGNPDWQFMEDYIKSLPYSKYL